MKRKTIFKILTLLLTFVVFSCCSGCFVESCISSCMDKQREKEKTKFLEKAQAKKAEADSFIPQVDDYILELKPSTCFGSHEEAYKAGFFVLSTPSSEMYYEFSYYFDPEEKTIVAFIHLIQPPNYIIYKYQFKCNVTDIYGYEFFFPHKDTGGLFHPVLLEYDGKFFAIQYSRGCFLYGRDNIFIPPALYMIDVENEQILYCGYFEQWYDDVFNNYNGGSASDYYYKITKKVSEENDNEEI